MSYITFQDAPPSAVLARVAYRLIELDHRRNRARYKNSPKSGICDLALDMQHAGFASLSMVLTGYAYHVSAHFKARDYRQMVIHRSEYHAMQRARGRPWSRSKPDPRVTNRGVMGRRSKGTINYVS